jgi:hypothetical protein
MNRRIFLVLGLLAIPAFVLTQPETPKVQAKNPIVWYSIGTVLDNNGEPILNKTCTCEFQYFSKTLNNWFTHTGYVESGTEGFQIAVQPPADWDGKAINTFTWVVGKPNYSIVVPASVTYNGINGTENWTANNGAIHLSN